MYKIFAAIFLISAGFFSSALSQYNSRNSDGEIRRTIYSREPVRNPGRAAVSAAEREAFELINKIRTDEGLGKLAWRDDLAAVARIHSQDMANQKYFSHRGSDGSMVDDRADRLGIRDWSAISENIAFVRGFDDAASFAVNRWMESSAHRQNLLNKRWTESAIGVAILPDGTYYFTQVFLLRD